MSVRATDLDQHQIELLDCDGDLPAFCVNLNRLMVAIPEGEITLMQDGGKLTVKRGKHVVVLNTLAAEEFPQFPDTDKYTEQGVQHADLAEGIRAVKWAAHEDVNAKPMLTNIHIKSEPKMLLVEASNGREGAFFERPLISPTFEALIPDGFAGRVADALECKDAKLFTSERGILVTHKTGSYHCKQGEGVYPNTKPIRDYKLVSLGDLELAPAIAIADTCYALIDSTKTPSALLAFHDKGMDVDFSGMDSAVSMTVPGKFVSHKANVNMTSFRKCLKSVKAEKCNLFNCNEGLAMAFRAGDLLVVSMSLR